MLTIRKNFNIVFIIIYINIKIFNLFNFEKNYLFLKNK